MRNGKRTLSLLLLALLVALLLPGAAHADPPKGDTHLHSWSVTSEKKATCTEAGSKTWKCSACGETYTETYPALGHSFDSGKITTQPTCTEYGVRTYTCSRCGEKKTSAIRPTGHTPAILPAEDPTCVDPGLTEGTVCEICNEILTPQEAIPATGHSWSDWALLTEATCTEGGVEIRSCLSCGAEETRPTDALGHAPAAIPGTAPTCEADGLTEGEVCSRCGAVLKAQQALPATGHSWDEGQVTREPSGFTPGVRTFTCRNDPGHTRTEEIDPAPWLFATFTGSIPDFTTFEASTHDLTPLTITEQPTGGSLTRDTDETVHLTCAATGGTGDYTYEWYSKKSVKVWGLNWPSYYGKQTEPGIDASTAGRKYWCVVTDSAGETAATDLAEVTYKIRIDKQPDNANLQPTGKATLSCEAADGSGSYSYRWIDNQDNEIDVGSSIDVTEIGDYMCIATDDVTGEEAHSDACQVYSTDPFTLVYLTGDCEYSPDNSGVIVSKFTGGVLPYEIWWDKDGEAYESHDVDDIDGYHGSVIYDTIVGNYTVHATDAMGATITATCHYTAPKLTIVEQPKDSIIPKGSYTRINVVVADGEMPYTYILYRNGEEYLTETDDDDSCPVGIWDPGEYYYHIEDSQGRQVDSDVVTFEDAVFRIVRQSNAGALYTATDTFTLSVEVEGGKEPYTYDWMQYRGDTPWYVTASTTATCIAKQPGKFVCRITDATGETIRTKNIFVLYNGQKPRIIKQPSGLTLTPDEKGHFSFSLSCEAASGNGDESCLSYLWERHSPDGYWSYAGSGKTMSHSLLGEYRCKVIDVISKEYTYTKTVTVAEGLSATVTRAEDQRSGYSVNWDITIRGGEGPYNIEVYLIYKYEHWIDDQHREEATKDVSYRRNKTVNKTGEETHCNIGSLENNYMSPWLIISGPDAGKTVNTASTAYYYVVVTDAAGRTFTTGTFSYRG